MNEAEEMVNMYIQSEEERSAAVDPLCLPVPPVKHRSWVRCVREWLNMDIAEANASRTVAIGCDAGVWSGDGFPTNAINNRRYSLLTFLPCSLFNQFRSFFNVFYLLLAFSQLIQPLKVGFIFTYFSPLAFVVFVSLGKDAIDDIKRYRRDRIANEMEVEKLFPNGSIGIVRAASIKVGDLLVLHHGQRIPADCVLLRTSDSSGTCFVRTDQLDGETDWKLRHALKLTQPLSDDAICRFRANIRCEALHKDIYKFAGMCEVMGTDPEAITLENTLWNNCFVASGTLIAAVLHTGVDTRSAMNSNKPVTKMGLMERELNFIGVLCFLLLVIISFSLVLLQKFQGDWSVMFLRHLILLSAIIPISMRVNVDAGRFWYSFEMFRDSKIPGTVVRNTNIPEELGRLQMLFSDKTGTLTKNKMEFRLLQVDANTILRYNEVDRFRNILSTFFEERQESGIVYSADVGRGGTLSSQRNFLRDVAAVGDALLALVLCHNVSPVMEDGCLEYQASSPDEVAFVKFCSSIGISLVHRDVNSIHFTTPGGRTVQYDIIKSFPFTSERKCMGIILRERLEGGEGGYKYLMKGADTKIATVVRSSDWLDESCQEFSQMGLRTLVFAQRTLTEEQLTMFLETYDEANADLGDTRGSSLDAAMRHIEKDMKLLCVTAVEDELQDDVTASIETLGMAGIKVWMLTGDKVETATNIGRSTRLIPRHGVVETLTASTVVEAQKHLDTLHLRYLSSPHDVDMSTPWTLILDGTSLSFCLEKSVSTIFLDVSKTAHSVIVARCSPTQKAAVVQAMRKHCGKMVRMAAIGDGGNDVSMILAADVGIGVEGVEGKQASMAADFSITKFAYCVRLIIWHGRNSYRRTCRMSQFIMHRGMVYSVVQAFFSLLFSGTTMSLFNGYLLMGYTTFFTTAPVFALVLDEDIKEEDVSEFPQYYKELLKGRSMNTRSFLQWALLSIYQGGVMMLLSLELFSEELFQIVAVTFTSLLLTELIIVACTAHLSILWKQRRKHLYLFIAAELFSIASYCVAVLVLPETIDKTFFFSWGCWWRVTVITLVILFPIYVFWWMFTKLLFRNQANIFPRLMLPILIRRDSMWSSGLFAAVRFSNRAKICAPRAFVTSRRFFHAQEINPGDISLIEAVEESHAAFGNTSHGGGSFDGSHEFPQDFLDKKQLDTFSRARVVNFIKRFSQGSVNSGNDVFQAQEVKREDGSVLYHCRVRLPFQSPSGEVWAHGLACNGKDAEMLAAMHAEYIIDEFGYHIYTLPSMQRKHAEAARKAGRWAPMPDDGDRAQTHVRIPLPLRRIVDRDETEGGKWLLIELRPNHYIAPHHTLLSPCLFDTTAVLRIKSLFTEHNLSFAQLCTSEAEEPSDKNGQTYYIATVILPVELTTFSEIKAQGKALSRDAAVTLACMHAELLLDAHSIALFPSDAVKQKQHALTAWSFGRPAPIPGEDHKNPLHVVCPLPLKEIAVKREHRVSFLSYEEDLVRRHRALTEQTCEFIETAVLDDRAVGLLKGYLKRENVPRTDPFFIEEVQGFVKASVVLPVPDVFGIRGGVGIAMNAADAMTLAAMHAIDVANLLGIHIIAEGNSRSEWIAERRSRGESTPAETQDPSLTSPPGRRRINLQSSSSHAAAPTDAAMPQAPKRRVPKRAKVATSSEETEKKSAEVDYIKMRESVPKEVWGLEPDSPDGYIMVSPNDPELRTQYEHALYSPRQIDGSAKVRIKAYLAAMGRRAEDVFFIQRIEAEDNGGQPICRCALNLPVPRRFGDRIALGEAVDPKDAENLAAMHAELILDTLGIPLYTDGALQRRHAELCLKNGRYAPMHESSNIPSSTASPPPLRREVVGSIHWENKTKKRASIVVSRPKPTPTPVSAVQEETDQVVTPKEARAYDFIPEKDLDLVSRARVQYYLRRKGKPKMEADFRMELRGLGNVLHVAELVIPVPASFGERIALGSALTKRDAEILCWMHAERIIDALGLCLFDNLPGLQKRHVERVTRLGRWAPLVGEDVSKPPDTSSPLPLTLGTAPEKPPYPSPPSNLVQDWDKYIGECQKYIEVNIMREENIFYEMEKIPRTGDSLYDSTVEEMESATVDADAKNILQRYCTAANVTYPVFWKSRTVGPVSRRVCLTTIEVPGHEYITASGVAFNKDTSQRRAAMHALALLRRVEPDFKEIEKQMKSEMTEKVAFIDPASFLEDDGAPVRRPVKPSKKKYGNWDPTAKDFSFEGKVRIIELFTVCFGLQPPLVRHMSRREGNLVHHSTTVEVTDEDGKLWVGEGQDAGPRFNESAAYEDLFSRLSRGITGFQALMDLIRNHSHLDPEHIANVSLTEAQKQRIYRVLEDLPDVEEEEVAKSEQWGEDKGEAVGLLARVAMDASERAQESQQLRDKLHEKLTNEEYLSKYAKKRQALSIFGKREEILNAMESSQIVIICGTTGCGKTTQVPQFILDSMTEKGEGGDCSIVITQPRRLSAVSIAQRVAAERLEGIGETCGYAIRLDSKPGRNINFCTSGILLRMLHNTPLLNGINYLIIDEIHERDINSDFLLILLRRLVRRRKDLRVILMSATLQAEQFGNYFDGAPIINVEGYVHPVKELYVEDLVPIATEQKVMPPLLKEVAASLEREGGDFSTSMDSAGSLLTTSPSTSKYGFMEATAEIDYVTIQFAIDHAVRSLDLTDSSILVFLPGWDEIHKACEILERNPKFHIICLHSSVGAEEQMRCFLPAPEGRVKLILSTNIAESGVTIDDVAVVIDLGRAKEKSYVLQKGTTSVGRNEMGSISQLVTVYASRANCVQRRGRVGRTRPGICIRLYSKKHFQTVHDFQTPEMLRTPLDALCLQILALDLGDPADFLKQAIEPPSTEHIEAAMNRLHELGATTSTRQLTPLGLRLSRLPVAPKIGKMIIMGAILKCLDSALTIAAVNDTDVFNSARDHREAVRLHKEDLSLNTQSDVIASVNAFNFWVVTHHEKTPAEVVYDLHERMLSVPQLLTVSNYKRQFFDIILNSGFLGDDIASRQGNDSTRANIFVDRSEWSSDALNVGLVKCVVASGLFPNVVMNRGKRMMRNKLVNRVSPSTASVVHRTSQEDITQPFFVYDELVKMSESDRLHVRGLTNIPLWTILLMGTSSMPVTYRDDLSLAVVDEWIMFRATFGTLELIRKFKRALNVCLGRKFLNPNDANNNEKLEELRCIIKELVSTPFKPNDLSDKIWEEKGVIIEPRTQPKKKEEENVENASSSPSETVASKEAAVNTATNDEATM